MFKYLLLILAIVGGILVWDRLVETPERLTSELLSEVRNANQLVFRLQDERSTREWGFEYVATLARAQALAERLKSWRGRDWLERATPEAKADVNALLRERELLLQKDSRIDHTALWWALDRPSREAFQRVSIADWAP
jgi:hypothetical protein